MKKIIYPTNKFEKTWQGKVNFAAKKPDNEKKGWSVVANARHLCKKKERKGKGGRTEKG